MHQKILKPYTKHIYQVKRIRYFLSTVHGMGSHQELNDAKVFLAVLYALSDPNTSMSSLSEVISVVASAIRHHQALKLTTQINILSLLIHKVSPLLISVDSVIELSRELLFSTSNDLGEDLEEVVNWILSKTELADDPIFSVDDVVLKSAHDLFVNNQYENQKYGFIPNSREEVLHQFSRAKLIYVSHYFSDINQFQLLLALCDPFFERYLVRPYIHYWSNYGSLYEHSARFYDFVACDNKFDMLIEPATRGKVLVSSWIENVILPIIRYSNDDFAPLQSWIFDEERGSLSSRHELWKQTLHVVANQFELSEIKSLVQQYLAACYYYTITDHDSGSIETTKIYDQISETVEFLLRRYGTGEVIKRNIEVTEFKSIQQLFEGEFAELVAPNLDAITTLNHIIQVCEKLYPINKLTVADYLKLKSSSDLSHKEKEVISLMNGLNDSNYKQLLSSVRLFNTNFIEDDSPINRLIVERFLFFDLFDIVSDFHNNHEFELDDEIFFELLIKKFWDSFNQATNLNEKIGKLHHAHQCIQLIDSLEVSEVNKHTVIKIKHLFKAMSQLRNFKLVVNRNALTPPDLQKYSPIQVVSFVLEQNPKSYLAFEKLYRILIDLQIFLDEVDDANYLSRVHSACIEAALIDGNFDFAYNHSIELFDHGVDLNEIWLTFYQVGKYVSPEWFEVAHSNEKIEVLVKQREILSLALKHLKPVDTSIDNSRLILVQWEHINREIDEWYLQLQGQNQPVSNQTAEQKTVLSNVLSDATSTTNHASEKLSNLFVSGLGWAIGANLE